MTQDQVKERLRGFLIKINKAHGTIDDFSNCSILEVFDTVDAALSYLLLDLEATEREKQMLQKLLGNG